MKFPRYKSIPKIKSRKIIVTVGPHILCNIILSILLCNLLSLFRETISTTSSAINEAVPYLVIDISFETSGWLFKPAFIFSTTLPLLDIF